MVFTLNICLSRVNTLQNANGVPNQLAMNLNGVQNHKNQQVEKSLKAVQSDQCLLQMILLIGSLRIILKL